MQIHTTQYPNYTIPTIIHSPMGPILPSPYNVRISSLAVISGTQRVIALSMDWRRPNVRRSNFHFISPSLVKLDWN